MSGALQSDAHSDNLFAFDIDAGMLDRFPVCEKRLATHVARGTILNIDGGTATVCLVTDAGASRLRNEASREKECADTFVGYCGAFLVLMSLCKRFVHGQRRQV